MSDLLVGTQAFCFLIHVYIDKQTTERVQKFVLFVQAAESGSAEQTPMLRSSSPEKCKTEQRASQFNCEFAGAGWAPLLTGGSGRGRRGHRALQGCPDASAPSPRGRSGPPRPASWSQMTFSHQWTQEKTELALSRERRCLHSALTSAGKNTMFINSAKRQPKHKWLHLPKLPQQTERLVDTLGSHAWGEARMDQHKSWLNKLFHGALQRGANRIQSVSLQPVSWNRNCWRTNNTSDPTALGSLPRRTTVKFLMGRGAPPSETTSAPYNNCSIVPV